MMRVCLIVLASLIASTAPAQEIIGRSIVDGRAIHILEDGTWAYAETVEGDCEAVTLNLQFCGSNAGWTPSPLPNPDITAAYRYDDRHYSQVITEELGVADGMTTAFMLDAVVQNAASLTGRRPEDIAVIDVYTSRAGSAPVETIVYAFDVDGLDVVYANSIYTSPNRTMQLMTYAIATEFTERHRSLHDSFLSNLRISK